MIFIILPYRQRVVYDRYLVDILQGSHKFCKIRNNCSVRVHHVLVCSKNWSASAGPTSAVPFCRALLLTTKSIVLALLSTAHTSSYTRTHTHTNTRRQCSLSCRCCELIFGGNNANIMTTMGFVFRLRESLEYNEPYCAAGILNRKTYSIYAQLDFRHTGLKIFYVRLEICIVYDTTNKV